MKDFKKKFPSLKGKGKHVLDVEQSGTHFHIEDIEKHCLDKEKVKKAINQVIFECDNCVSTDLEQVRKRMELLIKDLGLE